MSDSVRPHRRQPTRLPCPWDSPGKNTEVGCHVLPQCMKVKSESEVAQSCLIPSDPMDCSLRGSSVHGIFQARVPEWVAIAFSHSTPHISSILWLLPASFTSCILLLPNTHSYIHTVLNQKGFLHLLECVDPLPMITFVHVLGAIFLKCFSYTLFF